MTDQDEFGWADDPYLPHQSMRFTMATGVDDVDALLAQLAPATAARFGSLQEEWEWAETTPATGKFGVVVTGGLSGPVTWACELDAGDRHGEGSHSAVVGCRAVCGRVLDRRTRTCASLPPSREKSFVT